MIDYIIIDNDENYRNTYKEIIKKIMFKQNINYQIYEYTKNPKNIKIILSKNNIFKIYLIDICQNSEYYGINLAKKIRENDYLSEIIFIGSNDIIFEPVFNSVRKIYCIIDKIQGMKEKLKNELHNIVNNFMVVNKFFPLDKKGNMQISLNEILYIYRETTERKIYVVTNREKFPVNMSLVEALSKCDHNFKQVHRACIVNNNQVVFFNWQENYFILKNGSKVLLCSKKYKENVEN